MKVFLNIFLVFLFIIPFSVYSQIETRLATNCATKQIEVPIILKNLENIKSFHLKLLYNNDVLSFDTSLYHFPDFAISENEIYQIKTTASNDTIYIDWNAYYGVNLDEGLLLSLVFTENGSDEVNFEWVVDESEYTDINGLNIASDYLVDASINIPFESLVQIDFNQFTTGCRDNSENGGCKAQALVSIEGGTPPYSYQWNDRFSQKDSIAIGLCEDPISVLITDASGCIYANLFDPVIYPAINPEDVDGFAIEYQPEEVYITKPYVEFTVDPGGTSIEKYEWSFGDESQAFTQSVEHTYDQVEVYNVELRTENIDGCDTTITTTVEIKELNFCIPNVFTPNGDGINDTWIFKLISADGGSTTDEENFKDTGLSDVQKCSGEDLIFAEHFKSTELVVFNRNGNKVFECTNCTDNWDGGGLPDGVYFYVFTWVGEYSNGKEHGNVTILGGSN